MNDYMRIKLVAWTAEIESLKADVIYYENLEDYDQVGRAASRLSQINVEILSLLGEGKKVKYGE